jgi:YHS domain-containing protein
MKKTNLLARLVAVSAILFSTLGFAGNNSETDVNGVILSGHDAVAYFTENAAVEGNVKFTAVHNDAIYRFSSAANRDKFTANPSKYAPKFGGFCAYGAALGKKFEIDGKAFEVVDGKLYVNKNLDVYEVWVEDKADNIVEADKQWTSIENVAAADL